MAKEEDAQRIAKNYVRRLARNITVRQAILTGSRATVKEAVRTGIVLSDTVDTSSGILLKPDLTTVDLAGSGKKHASVSEMKRLLDRMRAKDV